MFSRYRPRLQKFGKFSNLDDSSDGDGVLDPRGSLLLQLHLEHGVRERGARAVSFPEWEIIERLEEEAAAPGAPRRKFITPAEMLTALDRAQAGS